MTGYCQILPDLKFLVSSFEQVHARNLYYRTSANNGALNNHSFIIYTFLLITFFHYSMFFICIQDWNFSYKSKRLGSKLYLLTGEIKGLSKFIYITECQQNYLRLYKKYSKLITINNKICKVFNKLSMIFRYNFSTIFRSAASFHCMIKE